MAIALVTRTIKAAAVNTGVTTDAVDTTGANLIVLYVAHYGSGAVTLSLSDSKGNTWTALTEHASSNQHSLGYYCLGPTVGTGHTFTVTTPGGVTDIYPVLAAHAFSGAAASAVLDTQTGATTAGATSLQPGSVTPSLDGSLVVAGIAPGAGTGITINAGFSAVSADVNSGVSVSGGAAYLIQTSAAAVNPTWSWTTSSEGAASIAVFKPTGTDTTPPTLSSPVGTATGATTATIGATTDEGNGTKYGVVTAGSTAPTAAQVKAGQDSSGSAAAFAGSGSVSATGVWTIGATGLTASTAYYAHLMQEDAAGNKSAVVSSAQFTTSGTPVTVSVTDANLFFSPYNWQLSGSTYAQSNNPGAYLKTKFTGTSVKLNVDVSPETGDSVSSGNYPAVEYSVDGGAFARYQLTSADTQIALATGLSAGTHTLEVHFVGVMWNTNDRWTTPVMVLRLTGLEIDHGASTAAPSLKSRRILILGDSEGEGHEVLASTVSVAHQNARLAYPALLGVAGKFNAEYGTVAFAGQGYTATGGGNVPVVGTAWDHYWSGASRLSGGLLSPVPYAVVSCHGRNDSGAVDGTVTTDIASIITAIRVAAGASALIFVCQSTDRVKPTAMQQGVTDSADAKAYWVDTGTDYLASFASGSHLSQLGQLEYVNGLWDVISADLPMASTGGGGLVGSSALVSA
jgi:hypothetical protein